MITLKVIFAKHKIKEFIIYNLEGNVKIIDCSKSTARVGEISLSKCGKILKRHNSV